LVTSATNALGLTHHDQIGKIDWSYGLISEYESQTTHDYSKLAGEIALISASFAIPPLQIPPSSIGFRGTGFVISGTGGGAFSPVMVAIPGISIPVAPGVIGTGVVAGHIGDLEARIPKPNGQGDGNRGGIQRGSDDFVGLIKRQMKKDLDAYAARKFHDQSRLTDRTISELISDAEEVYREWGKELPSIIAGKRPH
jgi:hypothetical protein